MKLVVACEESQVVCSAFRAKGHEAYSADIVDCSGGHPEWHIKGDVLDILDDRWDMMIAHPDCKRLTNAGVRWLTVPPKGKTLDEMWKALFKSAEFYLRLRNAPIKKKAIENPVMHCYAKQLISDYWIKPRQIVQPWWFGDKAFKATGFELHNVPNLVQTNRLTPPERGTQEHKEWSFIHRAKPGPDRARLRSKTFPGIASAMAEQWG